MWRSVLFLLLCGPKLAEAATSIQASGVFTSTGGRDYHGSYSGQCVNDAGGVACVILIPVAFQSDNLDDGMDFCDSVPGCMAIGTHYSVDRLYGDCAAMFAWNAQQDPQQINDWNIGATGTLPWCPDMDNHVCGDGTPTSGCYVAVPLVTTMTVTQTTVTSSTTSITASSTTVTISTTSITTSSTTITRPEPSCSSSGMVCPVPSHLQGGSYAVLGNESAPGGPCAVQGSGDIWWFDIPFGECNVSRTESQDDQTYVVTLVRNATYGEVLFDVSAMPTIICRCQQTIRGAALASLAVELEFEGDGAPEEVDVSSPFNLSLAVHSDDVFGSAVTPGQLFPSDADRIYLEAQSDNPDDIIGFEGCVASPTGEAGDPHEQPILQSSCPESMFDWQGHSSQAPSAARASVRTFKFAGITSLFITCTMIRCEAEPCAQCGSSAGRRLQGADSASAQARVSLRFESGAVSIVLPAALSEEALTSVWQPTDAAEVSWAVAQQQMKTPFVVQSSFTLYGCDVNDTFAFADAAREALASGLGLPEERVRILGVSVVRSSAGAARRLAAAGQQTVEAVVVDFEVLAASAEEAAHVQRRLEVAVRGDEESNELLTALQGELNQRSAGVIFIELDTPAVTTPLSAANSSSTLPDSGGVSAGSVSTSMVLTVAALVVVTSICVASHIFCKGRCRRDGRIHPDGPQKTRPAGKTQSKTPALAFSSP